MMSTDTYPVFDLEEHGNALPPCGSVICRDVRRCANCAAPNWESDIQRYLLADREPCLICGAPIDPWGNGHDDGCMVD
jgi:hypothetical protein